ncbi:MULTISPECIES: cation:proton antiporter [unclassified Paenibacillus]|uniref:cation:proton antiporter n=1 Tax=unclassified Paenibacillus TaxID=185978 RepID=UPI0024065283|nr:MULTISPECIES: cation:proton antiporter [unclassified Paenibacillus]MDF9843684.1 CPA1 family monovalent cation:H+ antiporter [Paenibacillus sp. PastF-2]MDF9850272.1 CPA1 family monovalent cation:H+ antiporter [Paenibacillus sp. PastM-2]MDF9856788.1 CPA1 family monovalent cation:H+ antiporter [Paenibacillus sp. PastF-1]MDH6482118.1 CPA1 family monovalent cation:H+ antiporter [Paenibacillus sp. PastH-2]MDH6509540.1 CPA1 family monovalent cation:H+ antiporter [Paenibacillus sp. PastM-3]
MNHFNDVFIQILILLAISMAVIAVAKKLNQPYSIALVVVGLLLGFLHVPVLVEAEVFITQSHVFQAIIISLFLPILLGDATLKLPFAHLREQHKPVLALAFGGTLLSFLIIGLAVYWGLGLPLIVSFTFAALMSATDPISVISIFKSLGVPKNIVTIIEGESLFNDGIAVVLFQISSVYLLSYMEMGWAGVGSGILLFLKFSLGGILIGTVMGYLFSQLIRLYDDYPLEIGFSMLLFFGSYFIAEHFHVSGVIAVAVSGLIFGNYGSRIGMSETTKVNINSFWDVITLVANSLIFLMIGLEIRNINFTDKWLLIIASILIVLAGRTLALYASLSFLKNFPASWKVVLNWGGLKGSLSIALALSLPASFDGREDILVLTFSIVLFSLLVQGLSIKPLVKKMKLTGDNVMEKSL